MVKNGSRRSFHADSDVYKFRCKIAYLTLVRAEPISVSELETITILREDPQL